MFNQKLLTATLITAVVAFILNYVWYMMLMSGYFPAVDGVSRSGLNYPAVILGFLISAYGFCRVFQLLQNSYEPLMSQAIRYGFLVALMVAIARAFFDFGTQDIWSVSQHCVNAIFQTIVAIILAIVVAKYYGPMPMRDGGQKDKGEE